MTKKQRRAAGFCVDCERDIRATNQVTGAKVAASTFARCVGCMQKRRDARYERLRKT